MCEFDFLLIMNMNYHRIYSLSSYIISTVKITLLSWRRDRYRERYHERDLDRYRDREHDRERERDRYCERDRYRECDVTVP